jgi:hypothetical protein
MVHLYEPKEDALVRRHKRAVMVSRRQYHPIGSLLNPQTPITELDCIDVISRVVGFPLVVRQHLDPEPPDSHEDKAILAAHPHLVSPDTILEASSSERY